MLPTTQGTVKRRDNLHEGPKPLGATKFKELYDVGDNVGDTLSSTKETPTFNSDFSLLLYSAWGI